MAEKRLWELLAKQFNKEISGEELRELQLLLHTMQGTAAHGELLTDLRALALRPDAADKAAKERSLSAIRKALRQEGAADAETPQTDGVDGGPGWGDQPGGADGAPEIGSGRRRSMLVWVAGVAAIFIFMLAGWLVWRTGRAGNGVEPFDRIVTKPGSKTLIRLPDSSTVVLNSACQFAYNKDFGVRRREMQLTGEAFFDIHSNPDMPLVVHAGNVLIRVLGTAFNVRANTTDSFVEATLVRGVIEVSLLSDPERKILLRPNEKILIRNSNEAPAPAITPSVSRGRAEMISVTKVEAEPLDSSYIETVWLKDRMVFRKEPFSTLAKRMERWYNVRIILSDSSLNGLQFTGSFEKETVDEAFRALSRSAPFSYIIEGRTITVTKRKGR